jgi:hypothetical protein
MNELYDELHEAINEHLENNGETQLEEVIGALHILQIQFETVFRANLLNTLTKEKDDAN